MAFDKVEALITSGKKGMPASVSLVIRGGGGSGRPQFYVSLSKAFVATFPVAKTDCFDLLIGSGDKKGLVRFKRNKAGIVTPQRCGRSAASTRFACGYIEKFGTEPEPRQFCNASIIDADTIEIVLPSWANEIEG